MGADEGRVPCPWCAEPIMVGAVVCRFCGRDVRSAEPLQAAEPDKESSGIGCLIVSLLLAAVIILAIFAGIASNYG